MDNSLIPRAFSPTDAKREREANAREAERRSSARNASSSTIGEGGRLDLKGEITVSGGGGIQVRDQGDIVVTSDVQNPGGTPYTISARLGNGVGGSSGIPSLDFQSTLLNQTNFATIRSVRGTDLSSRAETPGGWAACKLDAEPGLTSVYIEASGFTDGVASGDAVLNLRPQTFHLRANDGDGNTQAQIKALQGQKMIISSVNGIDIQGALTNNGAPISGGGGAVSSVAGKTGDVTLVKADVDLGNVDNTSDLNKPISAATQTALDGKANTGSWHAEFTLTNVTVPSGGPLAAYTATFSPDYSKTTGPTFATTPANGKIGLTAGSYAVQHFVDCKASMGTGAVVAIQDDGMTMRHNSLDVVAGSWNGGVNDPTIFLPTATNLTFSVAQFGGATRSANVRVKIEKIK